MHKKNLKYSFVRSFRIQFTIDFTFDDHIKVIASKNKRLRKSIVKNTLLNIWPLLFTCIMCYCNLFFLGGKTCAGMRKKFLENTLKFSEFLKLSEEIILRSKKYVECFCLLINDFFLLPFLCIFASDLWTKF